jgi:hypothetical protein
VPHVTHGLVLGQRVLPRRIGRAHGVLDLDVRTYVVEVVRAELAQLHTSRVILGAGPPPLVFARGGFETGASAPSSTTVAYLVVGNGTACRSEKAPGHLDERALGFDAAVEAALRAPDAAALAAVDEGLAGELWVGHPAGLRALGELLAGAGPGVVDYADDPFGVRYWVMRWSCVS